MAYNTSNPVGSTDPRDLHDNAENLDEALNGEETTWVDRLGNTRTSFRAAEAAADAAEAAADRAIADINALDDEAQQALDDAEVSWESRFVAGQDDRADRFETAQDSREAQFVQLMISGGYTGTGADGAIEEYASGITVSAYKEIIRENGEFWRPAADTALPYTTTGEGMPEGGAFVNVGDGVLRQDLVQPVATFNNVADMKASIMLDVGRKARTLGYYTPGDGGGNDYEIVVAATGSNYGFLFEQLTASGLEAKLLGGGIMEDKTAYIPSDYGTLQDAIDKLGKVTPTANSIIDLFIETAHSPGTGILVSNGDFSHFRVSSVDAEVTVALGFGKSAAFIQGENARMPVLNCLVNGNAGEMGYGYYVKDNSAGYVTAGSGAKACWQDGLAVKFGAVCYALNSVFTGNAVNATTSSNIHAVGGICYAEGANASGSNYYGVQSTSGGVVVFRGGNANNSSSYGLRTRDQGMIDAEKATANDCGTEGVRAFISGYINFRNGQAQRSGQAGISASRGSIVAANGANVADSLGFGVNCTSSSSVDIDGGTITGCADSGVRCAGGRVFANRATISNNARGVEASSAGIVSSDDATIQGSSASGITASGSSKVSSTGSTITGNDTAVTCVGSEVDVSGADCQSSATRGVYAHLGGRIIAVNSLCQKTPGTDTGSINADITCRTGGIIHAEGASGGVNKVANSLSADGIIFRT